MKTKAISFLAMMTLALVPCSRANAQQLFDSGWQFTRNGQTIMVDLPHDWDIYDAPDPATGATGTGGGWFAGGKGEYRKMFKTPGSDLVKLPSRASIRRPKSSSTDRRQGSTAMAIRRSPSM